MLNISVPTAAVPPARRLKVRTAVKRFSDMVCSLWVPHEWLR